MTISSRGADHAYERLLSAAFETGERLCREIAEGFVPEALDAAFGAACADFDDAVSKGHMTFPYEIVRNVCDSVAAEKRCSHDWQEQPGEPPCDVCSSCGKVRW